MKESESSITKAWLAAIEASPIRAINVVKKANDVMSMNHWPPMGAPVRRTRRMAAARGDPVDDQIVEDTEAEFGLGRDRAKEIGERQGDAADAVTSSHIK